MSLSIPTQLTVPFADAGLRTTIPAASNNTTGRAGYDQGFPPINMVIKAAGGIPPFGQDMNGILYAVTLALRYLEAGGAYVYDTAFSTAIGGYNVGARVLRTDGLGYWLNTIDANTTNPESAGAAAAGWVPDYTNGVTAVTMTNANVTLTAVQYGKPVIVITGLLTANLNLIFPAIAGQWVVRNNTTGAFTITCKTAAGTGSVVTQGGGETYYGNGTNLVPLAVSTQTQSDNSTKPASTAYVDTGKTVANQAANPEFTVNQDAYVSGAALAAGVYGHDQWRAGAGGCTYTYAAASGLTTATITAGTLVQPFEAEQADSATKVISWTGTAQARLNSTGAYAASPIYVTGLALNTAFNVEFNTGTLTQLKVANGTVLTPYVKPNPQADLDRCLWFYWINAGAAASGADFAIPSNLSAASTNAFRVSITMPTPMRITPVVTVTAQTQVDRAGGNLANNSGTNRYYLSLQGDVAGGNGSAQWQGVKWRANARLP